jgi:3-oxoadipate enol-lactonase
MMSWTETSGVSIGYRVSGPTAAPVVVLIHELGGSLESWQGVAARLDSTFRVLSYDQRGAGQSEKVRHPFAFEDHVNDLLALLQAMGHTSPVHVAGVASGAAIALLLAARHPDRVGRLVLCAPAVVVSASRRAYFVARTELAARAGMRAVVDDTLSQSYPPVVRREPAVFEEYRSRFLANDPVAYGSANMAFADAGADAVVERVANRCLLLAGAHDGLRPPEMVRALAERLPDARHDVIAAGHAMNVQAPAELAARMLAFLSE